VRERYLALASRCRALMRVHILSSRREAGDFADRV
jgi:hypothetical protein